MALDSHEDIYLMASHNILFPFVGATTQEEFAFNMSLSLPGKRFTY